MTSQSHNSSAHIEMSVRPHVNDDNHVTLSYYSLFGISAADPYDRRLFASGPANADCDVPSKGKFVFLPQQQATVFCKPTACFSTIQVRRRQQKAATSTYAPRGGVGGVGGA